MIPVTLTGLEEEIDASLVTAEMSGFFGGWQNQGDNMTMTATFYGAEGNPLSSFAIGEVTAAERGNTSQLLFEESDVLVPVGARSAEISLTATRTAGAYNDGYADNLSFSLSLNNSSDLSPGDINNDSQSLLSQTNSWDPIQAGQWQWFYESEVTYVNWALSEPNTFTAEPIPFGESYGMTDGVNGGWNDLNNHDPFSGGWQGSLEMSLAADTAAVL